MRCGGEGGELQRRRIPGLLLIDISSDLVDYLREQWPWVFVKICAIKSVRKTVQEGTPGRGIVEVPPGEKMASAVSEAADASGVSWLRTVGLPLHLTSRARQLIAYRRRLYYAAHSFRSHLCSGVLRHRGGSDQHVSIRREQRRLS